MTAKQKHPRVRLSAIEQNYVLASLYLGDTKSALAKHFGASVSSMVNIARRNYFIAPAPHYERNEAMQDKTTVVQYLLMKSCLRQLVEYTYIGQKLNAAITIDFAEGQVHLSGIPRTPAAHKMNIDEVLSGMQFNLDQFVENYRKVMSLREDFDTLDSCALTLTGLKHAQEWYTNALQKDHAQASPLTSASTSASLEAHLGGLVHA